MDNKLSHLEAELEKYEKKYAHVSSEFAATKEGSAYGVEYYDIQCRVLQSMINGIEREILELRRKND